ncbi:hypothetical protein OEJ37_32515, partial [Burkholderia sp. BKH01]|uniref:hypothetical protein n=1 Tax=Burkholderia sp. BKH01 TaxID=2769262 RepID=UPI0021E037AD
MNASDDTLEFTGGLVARLPEPADFGIALAEGFARRIGDLARRAGAPAAAARWARPLYTSPSPRDRTRSRL